jgi:hypothetical protein
MELSYFMPYDGMINGHPRCQVLVSETCKYFLIWKKGLADVTKLKVLGQEDYPGLLGWTLNSIPVTF